MDAHIIHEVRLYYKPEELRKLADKIEDRLKNGRCGESLIVSELHINNICIKILAEQE